MQLKKIMAKSEQLESDKKCAERELEGVAAKHVAEVTKLEERIEELRRKNGALDCRVKVLQVFS